MLERSAKTSRAWKSFQKKRQKCETVLRFYKNQITFVLFPHIFFAHSSHLRSILVELSFRQFLLFSSCPILLHICQCKSVELKTVRAYPMQIDGEPFLMKPCTIRIENDSSKAPMAKLLRKDNNKTQFYRDEELEEWAATTIQRSFRNSRKKRDQ